MTLRFPVAAVTAQSDSTGTPVLGTTVTDVRASSSASTDLRVVATDSATGAPFVLGG